MENGDPDKIFNVLSLDNIGLPSFFTWIYGQGENIMAENSVMIQCASGLHYIYF